MTKRYGKLVCQLLRGFYLTSPFYGDLDNSIVGVHRIHLIGRACQPLLYFLRRVSVFPGVHNVLIGHQREGNAYEQKAHHDQQKGAAAEPPLCIRDHRPSQAEHQKDHAAREQNREKVGEKEERGTYGCTQLTLLERNADHAQRGHERDGDGNAAQRVGNFGAGGNEGAAARPNAVRSA